MRVAIIGGGTAGFMAAAHLTRHVPEAELLHVFDSRIPTIGVGEGTTPRFPTWFHEITALGLPELSERCNATRKIGTRFEGWGRRGGDFVNRFQPVRYEGYHFDASRLVELLGSYVGGARLDARVVDVRSEAEGATVTFEDGTSLRFDYIVDARGFPRPRVGGDAANAELLQLSWIPTRAAIVGRGSPTDLEDVTRAVARPHGWIFQIPLRHSTSCGYIFDPDVSSEADVNDDFDAYLVASGVDNFERRGRLGFPNFVRRDCFDGSVFSIGNAASFIEPLEATAIGTIIVQLRALTNWIKAYGGRMICPEPDAARAFSRSLVEYVCKNSLFLAWHYAHGSRYDTAFWRRAASWLERARHDATAPAFLGEFDAFVEAGRALPGLALPQVDDQARWDREVAPLLSLYRPFGNFSELNFAQVGYGLGAYDTGPGVVHSGSTP